MQQNDKTASASISGAGKVSGGQYETVAISGAGKVDGDIQAREVRVSGAGKFAGSVQADVVRISGAGKIQGALEAGEAIFSGSAKVNGPVRAERLTASGACRFAAGLKGREVNLSGATRVTGDVEVESFRASGAFRVDGLVNAERVHIRLYARARVREIGGTSVVVERKRMGFWGKVLSGIDQSPLLETDLIEADQVSLENTKAQTVRGARVRIGPGCEIDTVEYGESLEVDDAARVGRTIRRDQAARTVGREAADGQAPLSGPPGRVDEPCVGDGRRGARPGESREQPRRDDRFLVRHPVLGAALAALAVAVLILLLIHVFVPLLGAVLGFALTVILGGLALGVVVVSVAVLGKIAWHVMRWALGLLIAIPVLILAVALVPVLVLLALVAAVVICPFRLMRRWLGQGRPA